MILTESQVLARLHAAIAEFPSVHAFALDRGIGSYNFYPVLKGRYKGTGFPPCVLGSIRVRKRVVYELIEDRKGRST